MLWTKEEVAKIASTYTSRRKFQIYRKSAYNYAKRTGILDEICSHMPKKGPGHKWTEEELEEAAKKYTTRTDFATGSPAAYHAAYGRGLLKKICAHMIEKRHDWTKEEIMAEAKKYRTRSTFGKSSQKAYRAATVMGILDEVCSHMVRGCEVYQPSPEEIKEEAKKYTTRTEFAKGSGAHYRLATSSGILDEVCSHMVLKRKPFWNVEELKAIALKYKTKKQFREMDDAAYQAAYSRGIIKEICAHMLHPQRNSETLKWITDKNLTLVEAIKMEAQKHKSRRSFRLGSHTLYQKASSLKILDEVCSHMTK